MMYQKVAFFLAVVIAGITAQDGTPPPEPCTTETDAMDKCAQDNKCDTSCPSELFGESDTSTMAEENPFPDTVDPMKDPEAAKVAYQNWFDVECENLKKDICTAKGCCAACSDLVEQTMTCATSAFPDMIQQMVGAASAAIAEVNNAAGTTGTVVPSIDFADMVSGWTCDFTDNTCGGSASTTSSPPSNSAGSTSSTSTPASGASSVGYMLAVISAASLVAIL